MLLTLLDAVLDVHKPPDGIDPTTWVAVVGIAAVYGTLIGLVMYLIRSHKRELKEKDTDHAGAITTFDTRMATAVSTFDQRLAARDTYIDKVMSKYEALVERMAVMMERHAETSGRLGVALENANAISAKMVTAVEISTAALRKDASS